MAANHSKTCLKHTHLREDSRRHTRNFNSDAVGEAIDPKAGAVDTAQTDSNKVGGVKTKIGSKEANLWQRRR